MDDGVSERTFDSSTISSGCSSIFLCDNMTGTEEGIANQAFAYIKKLRDTIDSPPDALEPEVKQLEQSLNPMEEIIRLDEWSQMSHSERDTFLNQMIPLRTQYRLNRESEEQCASEALAYFRCSREAGSSLEMMKLAFSQLRSPTDPCGHLRKAQTRCLVMMNVSMKARLVFGQYANDYIRIVDLQTQEEEGKS